ncbi:MAG: winged helix-turn-helix domain-containing protein [Candidatus Omnitrophica bacterium]|nr:winged helix-turn-helix domain-containing protein [Candidatus Omnitrophota bacterium]
MPVQLKAAWGVAEVGEIAGQAWQCLSRTGKTNLAAVEKQLGVPAPVTHMAIGWLAREGKVGLQQNGRHLQVWLTESA